ncbi:glycogen/starch/alpha-glucan family phosphorylase [Leptothermofonsia sp. ETS-13]|uniref:glycogen/starch/alpha-glucan family phosphorylase n=1 Tax=Leptothermofonsia sp. ETS-13 TaxID=3035696 RepID=UPI003BA02DAF
MFEIAWKPETFPTECKRNGFLQQPNCELTLNPHKMRMLQQLTCTLKIALLIFFVLPPWLTQVAIAAPAPSSELPIFQLPIDVDKQTTVRIDGDSSMVVINQLLKEQYQQQFPGTEVEIDTQGTDTALQRLLKDEIDLAAIGRPLTASEKAKGLIEIPLSQERIAVIVGRDNPFKGNLTVEQFIKIVRGEITDWAEVGGAPSAIRFIDRPTNSDTRIALSRYGIFQDGGFTTGANAVQMESDDTAAIIQQLGRDGIGYAIASQLVNQNKARIVKLVVMHEALPDDPLYPYAQPRGYAYKKSPDLAASSFLGLATAEPGKVAINTAKTTEAKAVSSALKPISKISIIQMPEPETSAFSQTLKVIPLWLRLVLPLTLVGLILQWVLKWLERKPASSTSVVVPQSLEDEPIGDRGSTMKAEIIEANSVVEELAANVSEPMTEPEAIVTEPATLVTAPQSAVPQSPGTVNAIASVVPVGDVHTGYSVETFKQAFRDNMLRFRDKTLEQATPQDYYTVLAYMVRDRLLQFNTPETYLNCPNVRWVGELSPEYMPGPHLMNNLINLGIMDTVQQGIQELGQDLTVISDQEEEPGLGKGGLGRLMVCYLDSLSTQGIPAIGYGLRYEYGIFDQQIQNGWQVEVPDTWLQFGNPWEIERPEGMQEVKFGGRTEAYLDEQGRYRVRWIPQGVIKGFPYDTPILGYRASTVNLLRLWRAETADNLCKTLYPVDGDDQGRAVRLKQQFFLISCSLQDAIRLHLQAGHPIAQLHERFNLQLNDTDSALAVVELLRLLLDEQGIGWEQAWEITRNTLSYTNHSLMPETLDDLWSVGLLGSVLPRHLEIVLEINTRFLEEVRSQYPNDDNRIRHLSLISEVGDRYLRLTNLACVGSHAINGVSTLHTKLLEQKTLPDFYTLYPGKFSNKTNGISPRRFLLLSNPALSDLITRRIGGGWITNLDELQQLTVAADDWSFRQEWRNVKQSAKQSLMTEIQKRTGIQVDTSSLFDEQAMIMHEYKRQHLNVLHILTLYNRIKNNPYIDITPCTFIFSGKAAPDYFIAKLMIKLIHSVADVINHDSDVLGRLKVVFLPDFTIKLAQRIYPAIELSEHISTAGTEAADTGNMIAALNGALIIGTPDGSNLEIRDAIGGENFFQFGKDAQEVEDLRSQNYNPYEIYNSNPELKGAIDLLTSGVLSNGDTELFRPLVHLLLSNDYYLLLADYASYISCQERVSQAYRNSDNWTRMSILSTSRIGKFSSDRAVREYNQTIWHVKPVTELREYVQA